MRASFLTGREADLVTWTDRFLAVILARPTEFGLVSQQSVDYQTTRTRFVGLYLQAQGRSTRTRVVVDEKNVAKRSLINATRMLVRVCEAWPQMTNAKRIELGIAERRPRPNRVPAPRAKPYLKVLAIDGREVSVALQSSGGIRTRPVGVESANLFVAYGEVAPEATDQWELYTGTTRSRVTLTLDKIETATRAWITAGWLNRRKESGPACVPIGVDLAAMSVVPVPAAVKIKKAA